MSINTEKIDFTRTGLKAAGFKGFQPLAGSEVPEGPGVYALLRDGQGPVEFQDPDLTARWVPDAEVLYIGQADTLNERISQLASSGSSQNGSAAALWGLADASRLTVAWLETKDAPTVRNEMLQSFTQKHQGRPPFGNVRKAKRK